MQNGLLHAGASKQLKPKPTHSTALHDVDSPWSKAECQFDKTVGNGNTAFVRLAKKSGSGTASQWTSGSYECFTKQLNMCAWSGVEGTSPKSWLFQITVLLSLAYRLTEKQLNKLIEVKEGISSRVVDIKSLCTFQVNESCSAIRH